MKKSIKVIPYIALAYIAKYMCSYTSYRATHVIIGVVCLKQYREIQLCIMEYLYIMTIFIGKRLN